MAGKIIWTNRAKIELLDIYDYWNNRNKSKTFSIKLNSLIQEQLSLVLDFQDIGKQTDIEGVSVKIIQKYLVYYEVVSNNIYVLSIRHSKRNSKSLNLQ